MNNRPVWIDGYVSPPPQGQKLLLLTVGGITTVGVWDNKDCVAWLPLPDTVKPIKAKMAAWAKGYSDWRTYGEYF